MNSMLLPALAFAAPVWPAQEVEPSVLLQSATVEVIVAIKQERES